MPDELIWRDLERERTITRSAQPSGPVHALLAETVWGSRATKYRILDLADKLARLRDPSFFVCSEHEQIQCVLVLDHCRKMVAGTSCGAYHFVMAATRPDRRNEGLAGLMLDHVRPYCERTVGTPGLGFAYVEATTEFTLKLSDRVGHGIEAEIPLTLFSRLSPRDDPAVAPATPADRSPLIDALEVLYSDHELSDFDVSSKASECFVHRRRGAISAAAQAEVLHWSVVEMPGLAGSFLLHALPRIPGLRNLLDLRDLRVLRFGNLLLRDGAEADLFALLETCLARHGARIGLIMLDARSPVLRRLRAHGRFGALSRALKGSALLHIDTVRMDANMAARLATRPLLVSPADVF